MGNWELVKVERTGADGERLPTPQPPSFGSEGAIGYIMYDPAGYMGVVIMQPGRQPYAPDGSTPDEAVRALNSYTSYFGTYTVNEAEGYLTHHLQGNVRPPGASNDNKRVYEFSGNQLILMPPVGDSGVQLRIVWQRVPDLPDAELTATHRSLFGFYRIGKIERHGRWMTSRCRLTSSRTRFIIYMPSGHMAVHLMRPRPARIHWRAHRRSRHSAQSGPTAATSVRSPSTRRRATLFTTESATLNPGQTGTDAQRFFELSDTTLRLRPPARMIDGRELQSILTWERL